MWAGPHGSKQTSKLPEDQPALFFKKGQQGSTTETDKLVVFVVTLSPHELKGQPDAITHYEQL